MAGASRPGSSARPPVRAHPGARRSHQRRHHRSTPPDATATVLPRPLAWSGAPPFRAPSGCASLAPLIRRIPMKNVLTVLVALGAVCLIGCEDKQQPVTPEPPKAASTATEPAKPAPKAAEPAKA